MDGLGDAEDDEYYGQLLRRPGDRPPYQSPSRPPGGLRAQQPGRFASPGGDYRPNGDPGGGYPRTSDPAGGYAGNGDYSGSSDPGGGYPRTGYPPNGDPAGRYPGSANPAGGYPRNGYPPGGGYPRSGNPAGGYGLGGGGADGGPLHGEPAGRRQYRLPNGRRVPPDADRLYHPGAPGSAGGIRSRPGTGQGQDPPSGTWSRPGRQAPAAGTPPGAAGAPSGAAGAYGGVRTDGGSGWEHLRVPPAGRGVPISAEPSASAGTARAGAAGPAGPVIRQRESALPDERPTGAAQPVASIAPDGLDSFARDLRALRARAELDYPEMAEVSHYTMKTLASAAGGLRLPTLPVAVAYVRACGGNAAEWEDRWQRLAAKITADAKKRRADGDDHQGPPEPADPPALPEPPALPAAKDPDPAPGEVYVITSAKPRQQDW